MSKESDVEKYLHSEIAKLGGTTRKWSSPNYVGVPDRIIIVNGHIEFTEVKTKIGKLSSMQEREIKRLRDHGCKVTVIYGKKGVDLYVEELVKRVSE